MEQRRLRIVYLILVPAIAISAAILGYFTYITASQFERIGEQSILQSTLLLVREKVDRLEQQIIKADNAVFHLVDPDMLSSVEQTWPALAERLSPSIRAVLVIDDGGERVAQAVRASELDQKAFLKVFFERILPDLELERQPIGKLKHLHKTYADRNYLISYVAQRAHGRRYYVVLHHDTGYIVRDEFPALFATEQGKGLYNVVDENNRRMFGPSLTRAGDYLVGHRFPTTLYNWRLQIAPKQAPLLEAKGRSRRNVEIALLVLSFAVILVGVAFTLYAADKERRLGALKSEFIANVSHELKTPLSIIRMFGEMLLTQRVTTEEKREQYLQLICRESERLTGLIDNVLDFSRAEHGKTRYEMMPRNLSEVVLRGVEAFRFRIEHGGADVQLRTSDKLPSVLIDEQAILLATVNLLDNAVKYGAGSTVEVCVEGAEDEIGVYVRDRGPGIPAEDLRRVFQRFYRVPGRSHVRGSGIGLSLVRSVAEAHGGRVWATNAADGGAIVGFALPIPGRATAHSRKDSSSGSRRRAPHPV